MSAVYLETFDDGPGGWLGWESNMLGPKALETCDGAVASRGPWWVDYNHAPPGAGYLHVLFALTTGRRLSEALRVAGGANRFIDQDMPRDFTDARITVRLRGELEARGATLCLLVQSFLNGVTVPWMLTGQPLRVAESWTRQTMTITGDESQWTFLGARHDRQDNYNHGGLADALRDVNGNIGFMLFPINVVPMGPLEGDPHILRPVEDYPIWRSKLPDGYVMLDEVSIEFATGDA